MLSARLREIVRRFPENGMKLMLENPKNARDLLFLSGTEVVKLIDCDHLSLVKTTFVKRDYRHVESDVVLLAPLRSKKEERSKKAIVVYILIEHQSEPDRLMPLRLLEYVVQIFTSQTRDWSREHRSFANVRLQPVLPVVFYTGTRRWDKIGRLTDLLEMGKEFGPVTPMLDPLFINLGTMQPGKLESEGGFFGWVLRLVQERKARPGEFEILVKEVVHHLETMPHEERLRWLELLSYIHALVYHERDPDERRVLQETIETSVQTDEHRREVFNMGRTIADALREEGQKAGEIRAHRQILLDLLQQRFGEVPPEMLDRIATTDDIKQLDVWLHRVLTAPTLAQMKIDPPRRLR
jgi:hypothetical protein